MSSMYNRPLPNNDYDHYSGYKDPVRPQTASSGFATPSPYAPPTSVQHPGYTRPPPPPDYGSSMGGGLSGSSGPPNLCMYHKQDLTAYCLNCNNFVCEACKLQCQRNHQHLPPQGIEAMLIKEAEQNSNELAGELNKRQGLDKQLFEMVWDPAAWNARAMNEIKMLETRLREALLQRQNEIETSVQRTFERRTEVVQNIRREISNLILYKGMAETLSKKIRSTSMAQTISKLKGYKEELEGIKQARANVGTGSTAAIANSCQQFGKMVSGEWKAETILEVYLQEGAGKGQIAQMLSVANNVADRVSMLEGKQKELDSLRDQEKALAASIAEAASQFKAFSSLLDEKPRPHSTFTPPDYSSGMANNNGGFVSSPPPARPYYPPPPVADGTMGMAQFQPQPPATMYGMQPVRPSESAYFPSPNPRPEMSGYPSAANGGVPAMYRPYTTGSPIMSPKYSASPAPYQPTTMPTRTIQCCRKSVDPGSYLSDLDRHNKSLMSTRPGEVYQEQLFCLYCDKTIYRSDLLAWEFATDQVDRVIAGFPSKKDEVPCTKCGKTVLAEDKVTPCEHTFHKRCLLEYLESPAGSNFQCQKCGKYLQDAYQSLSKERTAKTRSCCICSSPQAGPYQTLSCGHYFCKDCFSKYYMSAVYFDSAADKGCRVRCQHCNSMVMLLKVKLDCGCVFELESLKQKLLANLTYSAGNALNFFCPNCKTKPIYSEEASLIFGYNQYQDMAKSGKPLAATLQQFKQNAAPMKGTVTYQKEQCRKCGVRADGVDNYKCHHVFFCRPCIKAMLDQLSKEGQHFKLIPQCESCAQYLNPDYLKEVHGCIDSHWRGTFLHRSYMDWRSKYTRQCTSCSGVTLKLEKDYICLDCRKKFPLSQLSSSTSVKSFAATSSFGFNRRYI